MRFDKYVSTASNLFIENRLCKFVIAVLGIVIISQLWMLNNSFRNQNTILVPPGLTSKVSLNGYAGDVNYLNAMGVYVSQLLYNFTPHTVSNKYKDLAALFDSEYFQENNKELISRANEYMSNEVAMSFNVMEIKTYINPNLIEITGEVSKNILGEHVESYRVTMKIGYVISNSLLRITSIEEKQ